MKVKELIDELSLICPNYDVMIKVGDDGERDLITGIHKIFCTNMKSKPPHGFVELETCNDIDWRRKRNV